MKGLSTARQDIAPTFVQFPTATTPTFVPMTATAKLKVVFMSTTPYFAMITTIAPLAIGAPIEPVRESPIPASIPLATRARDSA